MFSLDRLFKHSKIFPLSLSLGRMSTILLRLMVALLLMLLISPKSEGLDKQWCIADEQTPDGVLQEAMDWACGAGGANCSNIQVNQPCYYPNTVKDHASYAFNSYFQKYKHKGGSCYFKGAAMITELDPSYDSCRYEYTP